MVEGDCSSGLYLSIQLRLPHQDTVSARDEGSLGAGGTPRLSQPTLAGHGPGPKLIQELAVPRSRWNRWGRLLGQSSGWAQQDMTFSVQRAPPAPVCSGRADTYVQQTMGRWESQESTHGRARLFVLSWMRANDS